MIPLPSAATCSGPCSCDYVVSYMFYDIFYSQSCITLAVRLVESGAVKCFVHAEHIAAAGAYRAHGNDGPRSARDSGPWPHCAYCCSIILMAATHASGAGSENLLRLLYLFWVPKVTLTSFCRPYTLYIG